MKIWFLVCGLVVSMLNAGFCEEITKRSARSSFPIVGDWSGVKTNKWFGYTRYQFVCDGCQGWVVEPKVARPGNHWIWCMEWPEAFISRTGALKLLEQGFYYIYISVGNTFGSPPAQAHFDAFYDLVTAKGLNQKGTLVGVSRGGLYMYGFAGRHPERINCIYGDAPVCDFKSWPGNKKQGTTRSTDWESLLQLYGFRNDADAVAYKGNPVDVLEKLAKANIPIIHVVGDADTVVPIAENSDIIEKRYKELGGRMKVFHKPTSGHHPHGLDDPAPLVEMIIDCAKDR